MTKNLLMNIDKLHTTKLGYQRIEKNLCLDNIDVVEWCKEMVMRKEAIITKKGKNWYVRINDSIITINAHSYTIITAHKVKI